MARSILTCVPCFPGRVIGVAITDARDYNNVIFVLYWYLLVGFLTFMASYLTKGLCTRCILGSSVPCGVFTNTFAFEYVVYPFVLNLAVDVCMIFKLWLMYSTISWYKWCI